MPGILVRFHQNHASDAAQCTHMEHGWKKDTAINGIEIKIRCISARKKQAESKIRNVNRARASFLQKR